ncbi:hypothetical protein [Actinophytocola xanthii]|uniref:Uncharacterized protein n=1 Tax=Actinophytocola xanthii TaxID=1912961 RepID=A0A1Q8CY23_9PSEU|nr:hypothetical protein [Actinophytocola xanthii]OLF19258.1 hypothetical protein BU204_02605 [Actinophytocola xanthii]
MVTSTRRSSPPLTIIASFLGFLASTVSVVAGGIVLATSGPELAEELRKKDPSMSGSEVDAGVAFAQGVGIAVAAVVALGYLWLAFRLKAGRNWARVVLTLLTVVQVAYLVAEGGGTTLGYVSCGLAVLAVVLSFLPPSNVYIATARRGG